MEDLNKNMALRQKERTIQQLRAAFASKWRSLFPLVPVPPIRAFSALGHADLPQVTPPCDPSPALTTFDSASEIRASAKLPFHDWLSSGAVAQLQSTLRSTEESVHQLQEQLAKKDLLREHLQQVLRHLEAPVGDAGGGEEERLPCPPAAIRDYKTKASVSLPRDKAAVKTPAVVSRKKSVGGNSDRDTSWSEGSQLNVDLQTQPSAHHARFFSVSARDVSAALLHRADKGGNQAGTTQQQTTGSVLPKNFTSDQRQDECVISCSRSQNEVQLQTDLDETVYDINRKNVGPVSVTHCDRLTPTSRHISFPDRCEYLDYQNLQTRGKNDTSTERSTTALDRSTTTDSTLTDYCGRPLASLLCDTNEPLSVTEQHYAASCSPSPTKEITSVSTKIVCDQAREVYTNGVASGETSASQICFYNSGPSNDNNQQLRSLVTEGNCSAQGSAGKSAVISETDRLITSKAVDVRGNVYVRACASKPVRLKTQPTVSVTSAAQATGKEVSNNSTARFSNLGSGLKTRPTLTKVVVIGPSVEEETSLCYNKNSGTIKTNPRPNNDRLHSGSSIDVLTRKFNSLDRSYNKNKSPLPCSHSSAQSQRVPRGTQTPLTFSKDTDGWVWLLTADGNEETFDTSDIMFWNRKKPDKRHHDAQRERDNSGVFGSYSSIPETPSPTPQRTERSPPSVPNVQYLQMTDGFGLILGGSSASSRPPPTHSPPKVIKPRPAVVQQDRNQEKGSPVADEDEFEEDRVSFDDSNTATLLIREGVFGERRSDSRTQVPAACLRSQRATQASNRWSNPVAPHTTYAIPPDRRPVARTISDQAAECGPSMPRESSQPVPSQSSLLTRKTSDRSLPKPLPQPRKKAVSPPKETSTFYVSTNDSEISDSGLAPHQENNCLPLTGTAYSPGLTLSDIMGVTSYEERENRTHLDTDVVRASEIGEEERNGAGLCSTSSGSGDRPSRGRPEEREQGAGAVKLEGKGEVKEERVAGPSTDSARRSASETDKRCGADGLPVHASPSTHVTAQQTTTRDDDHDGSGAAVSARCSSSFPPPPPPEANLDNPVNSLSDAIATVTTTTTTTTCTTTTTISAEAAHSSSATVDAVAATIDKEIKNEVSDVTTKAGPVSKNETVITATGPNEEPGQRQENTTGPVYVSSSAPQCTYTEDDIQRALDTPAGSVALLAVGNANLSGDLTAIDKCARSMSDHGVADLCRGSVHSAVALSQRLSECGVDSFVAGVKASGCKQSEDPRGTVEAEGTEHNRGPAGMFKFQHRNPFSKSDSNGSIEDRVQTLEYRRVDGPPSATPSPAVTASDKVTTDAMHKPLSHRESYGEEGSEPPTPLPEPDYPLTDNDDDNDDEARDDRKGDSVQGSEVRMYQETDLDSVTTVSFLPVLKEKKKSPPPAPPPKPKKRPSINTYENWTINKVLTHHVGDSISDDFDDEEDFASSSPMGSKDSGLCLDALTPPSSGGLDVAVGGGGDDGEDASAVATTTLGHVGLRGDVVVNRVTDGRLTCSLEELNQMHDDDDYVNIAELHSGRPICDVSDENQEDSVSLASDIVFFTGSDTADSPAAYRRSTTSSHGNGSPAAYASDDDERLQDSQPSTETSFDDIDGETSSVLSPRDNMMKMRFFLVKSVLDSEKVYLAILELLLHYKRNLQASCGTSQPVISEEDITKIFGNLEHVSAVHKKFVEGLQQKVANWSDLQTIGDVFDCLVQNFSEFSSYAKNYKTSVSTIHKCCQDSQRFQELAKEIVVTSTTREVTCLEDALFKPVQRLQRNTLVLHDLIKHTPHDHPDYEQLKRTQISAQQNLENFSSTFGVPKNKMEEKRNLVKSSFLVELVGGQRKLRFIFLFSDVLVCTKREQHRVGKVTFDCKWFIPMAELKIDTKFSYQDDMKFSKRDEIDDLKKKLRSVKNELKSEKTQKDDGKEKHRSRAVEKQKKKVNELEAQLILASPKLPFKVWHDEGKTHTLLMTTDYEREEWREVITSIKRRSARETRVPSLFEVQETLNAVKDPPQVNKIGFMLTETDEELIYGTLNVTIHKLNGLKEPCDTYCCLEMDSYGHFFMKARTHICSKTADPSWNEDFELELEGSQTLRVLCYRKGPDKQSDVLLGRGALEMNKQWLKGSLQEKTVAMNEYALVLSVRYTAANKTMPRMQSKQATAVFGCRISACAKREGKSVPTIVSACVQEVEKRGMDETGIYRVSGITSDVQKLKKSFDKNVKVGAMNLADVDIHSVTGVLKLYFRELPEPLFTEASYSNFMDALKLSDEEGKENCLLSLLHNLPETNYYTAVFLLEHLLLVSRHENQNKMSIHNLSTIFGPTLMQPASKNAATNLAEMMTIGAEQCMKQSAVIYYFLTLLVKGKSLRRSSQSSATNM